MSQNRKKIFQSLLSCESLETRVNLSAAAYGVPVAHVAPAAHVSQPLVVFGQAQAAAKPAAAAVSQQTIDYSGTKGDFSWTFSTDDGSTTVSVGSTTRGVELNFSAPAADTLLIQGTYYYQTPTLVATIPFAIEYVYDNANNTVAVSYGDSANSFTTTQTVYGLPSGQSGDTVSITTKKKTETITKSNDSLIVTNSKRSETFTFTSDGLTVSPAPSRQSQGALLDAFRDYAKNVQKSFDAVTIEGGPTGRGVLDGLSPQPRMPPEPSTLAVSAVAQPTARLSVAAALKVFVDTVNPARLYEWPRLEEFVFFIQDYVPTVAPAGEVSARAAAHVSRPAIVFSPTRAVAATATAFATPAAAAMGTATIPYSGAKGNVSWSISKDDGSITVTVGNAKRGLELTFSSPSQDTLSVSGLYYYQSAGVTAKIPFTLTYAFDVSDKAVTVTYADASNSFSTTQPLDGVSIARVGSTVTIATSRFSKTITSSGSSLILSEIGRISKLSETFYTFTKDTITVEAQPTKGQVLADRLLDSFKSYAKNLKTTLDAIPFRQAPSVQPQVKGAVSAMATPTPSGKVLTMVAVRAFRNFVAPELKSGIGVRLSGMLNMYTQEIKAVVSSVLASL